MPAVIYLKMSKTKLFSGVSSLQEKISAPRVYFFSADSSLSFPVWGLGSSVIHACYFPPKELLQVLGPSNRL
jgi:hypothetical protein